jgi:glycerophosphoryl diester phosphodiesterase
MTIKPLSLVLCTIVLLAINGITFAGLPSDFDLQAHRGGRDARPENTLPAFAYALAIGVTTLEMDMQITADGVIVIRHNKDIPWYMAKNAWGRFLTADEQPDIRFWRLEDLRNFDIGAMSPDAPYGYWDGHGRTQTQVPGTKLCTLEEVFMLVKSWGNDKVYLNIETKSYPYAVNPANPDPAVFVKKFYHLVKKHNMQERVFLQSFDWRTLVEMKKLDPRIPTVALTGNQPAWNREGDEGDYQWPDRKEPSPWMAGLDIKDFGGDVVRAAHAIHADVITPYHTELTKERIDEAHSLGMRVVPYTVNDPSRMRELIKMGVDGIITDRPATLRTICQELEIKLPAPDPDPAGKPYYTGANGL